MRDCEETFVFFWVVGKSPGWVVERINAIVTKGKQAQKLSEDGLRELTASSKVKEMCPGWEQNEVSGRFEREDSLIVRLMGEM